MRRLQKGNADRGAIRRSPNVLHLHLRRGGEREECGGSGRHSWPPASRSEADVGSFGRDESELPGWAIVKMLRATGYNP